MEHPGDEVISPVSSVFPVQNHLSSPERNRLVILDKELYLMKRVEINSIRVDKVAIISNN
jgi:hypothetical protein